MSNQEFFEIPDIQELGDLAYKCNRIACGMCTINCSSFARFRVEPYSARGRMRIIRHLATNRLNIDKLNAEAIYRCTLCKFCDTQCLLGPTETLLKLRILLVEAGKVPKEVAEFLRNLSKFGNPWGKNSRKGNEWADSKHYNGNEYLIFSGSIAPFDDRTVNILKALKEVCDIVGVDYGVLREECNDGNEALMLGELGLFEEFANRNAETFEKLGVGKIVTPDPHAFNVLVNYYPLVFKTNYIVQHHTQFLASLVKNGDLKLGKLDARVTYHDPCFLGRWNNVYNEPRDVLKSIPNLDLVEMPRNKADALCCGGGAGNFYFDYLGGKDSPARQRVREASKVGEILVTACPACLMMLETAARDEGVDLVVKDVAEILLEALKR